MAMSPARHQAENTRERLAQMCLNSSPVTARAQNSRATSAGGGSSDTCGRNTASTNSQAARMAAMA